MYENFIFVSNNLTEREKLEQLAEEATELAQAAKRLGQKNSATTARRQQKKLLT